MTPDRIRSDTSKCDETRQATFLQITDTYDLLRIINTLNTPGKITFINLKSEGCQEMAAETGMERGRIRH